MSFYDVTKESVLRPEDLFKYRLKKDCTIPSRGGQKEFEPDGSWLQIKRLEAFLQERTTILAEPRVEKLKNIVEGQWDKEKFLVNLKRPGKFWMHMGFTDERRNWLYPEEALFLMETNTLEVYNDDRPMSIQEAYSKLLGHGMCLEEYQVFSHLRRLGYVVLRHEEERIFTKYERQINIPEYVDKKTRKEKLMKGKGKSSKKNLSSSPNTPANQSAEPNDMETEKESNSTNDISTCATLTSDTSTISKELEEPTKEKENINSSEDNLVDSSNLCLKRKLDDETEDSDSKAPRLGPEDTEEVRQELNSLSSVRDETHSGFYNMSSWSACFRNNNRIDLGESDESTQSSNQNLKQTVLDSSSSELFPDFGESKTDELKSPPPHLMPSSLGDIEIEFGAAAEKLKNPALYKISNANDRYYENEGSQEKRFSCLERFNLKSKINAGSWSEYKRLKAEKLSKITTTPVDHLWNDVVTPLMRPTEITSYKDVMDRLQIIQSADNESLTPDVSVLSTIPKISFDVHLPDHRFKKTMPGIPDHRVHVTRRDGPPPGLTAIQHLWSKYKDDVPIHWAVVDCGEIAFYIFDNCRSLDIYNP